MKNWPVKKLGEVAEIIVGKTPGTIDYLNSGEYKVLKYRDITKNGIDWDKYDKGFVKQNSLKGLKEVQLEDLLITSAGHSSEKIGEEAVVIEKLPSQFKKVFFASELICYRAIPKIILPEWLLLYILSEFGQSQLKKIIGDSVHLTKEKSQEIEIPVPAIEEQRRIVKKLEKILAKIEESCILRQRVLKDNDALFKSALNKVFDKQEEWVKSTASEASKEIITGSTPNTKERSYFGGNIKWVTPGDFNGQKWIKEARQFVSEKAVKEKKVRLIPNNSVMLVSIGATVGKLGIASEEMATNQQINSLVFDDKKINPKFAYYYLLKSQEQIINIAVAATLPIINKTKTGELTFCYPEDLKKQEEIVAYLDGLSGKVQALQKLQQEQLQELEALQQSVLHQAFQGEL